MLGLVVAIAMQTAGGPALNEVARLPFKGGIAAVVARHEGKSFTLIKTLDEPSKFIGLQELRGFRYDLVSKGLVARRLSDNAIVWRRQCADAIYKKDKLYCLVANDLLQVNEKGRTVSRKRLTRSSIEWSYLDAGLRYALGFRPKPEKLHTWPLFMLDLSTLKVRQLQITYDLGGHVDPIVVSSPDSLILYDLFYTHIVKIKGLEDPPWDAAGSDYYTFDHILRRNQLLLLERSVATSKVRIVDVSNRRVVAETTIQVTGFVLQQSKSAYVYSTGNGLVTIYSITMPVRKHSNEWLSMWAFGGSKRRG